MRIQFLLAKFCLPTRPLAAGAKRKWILPGAVGAAFLLLVLFSSARAEDVDEFILDNMGLMDEHSAGGPQRGQRPGQAMRPPMPMGGGAAVSVSGGAVFVVSHGQLFKYDQKTLNLQASVPLQPISSKKREAPADGKTDDRSRQGISESPDGSLSPGEAGRGMGAEGAMGRSPAGGMGGMGGMGGPRMMGGSEVALSVADDCVFVVAQGKLLKYSSKNLEFQGSADLRPKPPEKMDGEKKPSPERSKGKNPPPE